MMELTLAKKKKKKPQDIKRKCQKISTQLFD
jgi:hypothetical protein